MSMHEYKPYDFESAIKKERGTMPQQGRGTPMNDVRSDLDSGGRVIVPGHVRSDSSKCCHIPNKK